MIMIYINDDLEMTSSDGYFLSEPDSESDN